MATVNYTTVELSAFYFDVLKDRLYIDHPEGQGRRSAQTVVYQIIEKLAQVMSPVLVFTADEVWRSLPGGEARGSVHVSELALPEPPADADQLETDWTRLIDVREQVSKRLEELRAQKIIGSSVDARVRLTARGDLGALLERHSNALLEALIVSQLEIVVDAGDGQPLEIEASKALGTKCARCWKWVLELSGDPVHAGVCGPCAAVLARLVPQPEQSDLEA